MRWLSDPRSRARRRRVGSLVAALAVGVATLSTPCTGASRDAAESAVEASRAAVGNRIGDRLLFDRDGKAVRMSSYRGRPLLVSFVYTGCVGVCPTGTRHLASVLREVQGVVGATAFRTLSVGFDLPRDSPVAMAEFARHHGASLPGWDFLSPAPADLPALARDLGFTFTATQGGFDHVTQVTVIDADGVVYRQVYGDDFSAQDLVVPLKELIAGRPSPDGGVKALFDRVRLLCTTFDPRTGRYGLDYGLFIEIGAGLSILGATMYVLVAAWWRSRRRIARGAAGAPPAPAGDAAAVLRARPR